MRKGISKAERRKAMALVEAHVRVANSRDSEFKQIPEFIGAGAYNCVYALSKDLVLRIQHSDDYDSSWEFYDVAQFNPHSGLPTVWELGEFEGRSFGIIERMDCTLRSLVDSGAIGPFQDKRTIDAWLEDVIGTAIEHVAMATGKYVGDTHQCNVMRRRKTQELVLTDCLLY